ncbi:MAG: DNA mismatch repair protein MutS [Acetobacteraceae bacterium]|nr:DNA mismatch repair protein MutS [Acetobacteraceae bacterium]
MPDARPPKHPPAAGATPAMAQWFAIKAEHPDALLFFRMGDFYELFFADAEAAAAALDIALTHRGEHAGAPIPMCGVPYHAAEAYLARLIRRGFRVAIVEQMENPKARIGKAPIRREVVRLITPGTITEESLLEGSRPNVLLALARGAADAIGAAWLDVSTGLFETAPVTPAELPGLLGRLDPAEILAAPGTALGEWSGRAAPEPLAPPPPLVARRRLAEAFRVASIDAFGSFSDAEAMAAAGALDYVRATQAGALPRLSRPSPEGTARLLTMDAATRTGLEILRGRDGDGKHTLLSAVQRTLTAAGARLLASWLAAPLTDGAEIRDRQDAWSWLLANPGTADRIRAALKQAPDMGRALGRMSVGRGGPRDLAAIHAGLRAAAEMAETLDASPPASLHAVRTQLGVDPGIASALGAALAVPAPLRAEDGHAIRPGFDTELDAERALKDDSRRVLAELQRELAERYAVPNLKIRHHAQLGYVIEAPSASVEALRAQPDLTLRQGMANGARFGSPWLAELDRRISEAAERAAARESAILAELTALVLGEADAIAACADALAFADVAQGAAALAAPGTWCRPAITEDACFRIEAGRHPVVESALSGGTAFVPNDCDLSPERRLLLLTGPNMAGKSTFLRQNALAVVLAQAGLPVPAARATIGVVDRLFSRVGASDDLARGRSTFMVEMIETAAILHGAGPRSLVVVDEIGRGTSTLDGLAIAWAVLEALHSSNRARTIFATHFHELAELADRLPCLAPHTMRVKPWGGTVVFLHEVAPGAAGRSWGVHVAQLAGVPASVVRRAGTLLARMEKNGGPPGLREAPIAELPLFAAAPEVAPEHREGEEALAALRAADPDRMTPREALDTLYRIRDLLPVPAEK